MTLAELMLSLTLYASSATNLQSVEPSITFVSENVLQTIKEDSTDKSYIFAVEDQGAIFLADTFNPNDILDQSILLHEIVHVLQDNSTKKYACLGAKEKEAYSVQDSWLKLHGASLKDLGIDKLWVIAISECN